MFDADFTQATARAAAFRNSAELLDGVVSDGMQQAARHVADVADFTIPFDTGALADSVEVIQDSDGSWLVTYGEDYAEIQHETESFQHAPGRRAKWLELTLEEEAEVIGDIYSNAVGEVLGASTGVGGRLPGFDGRTRYVAPPSRLF